MAKTTVAAPKRAAKKDAVQELYSLLQQVRREPATSVRPNKWRTMWIKDVGSLLTRLTTTTRKLAAAESKIKTMTE